MMFTARDKATEARREVGYRRRVYARLVGEGKMKGHDADRQIAIMEAIAADYAVLAEAEEKKERLL
jgi:hypothetical protein